MRAACARASRAPGSRSAPRLRPGTHGPEDAEIFLDELERLEEAGGLPDPAALEASLEKLYALPDVNAGPGAVEIMTIHKAKGLEWDNVIVPGLDRAPRSGERQLFAWKQSTVSAPPSSSSSPRTRGPGLFLAPINETGTDKEPLYEYVRSLDKEAEDIEAGRPLRRRHPRQAPPAPARLRQGERRRRAEITAQALALAKALVRSREMFSFFLEEYPDGGA
jgi:hypothetical protein